MMKFLLPVRMIPGGTKFFNSLQVEKKFLDLDPLCLGPNYNIFLKSPVCEDQNGAGPICVGQTV